MKKYSLHFKVSNEKSFCTGKIKNKDYNAMVVVVKKWRKPKNANGNGKTRQQIVYYVTEYKDFAKASQYLSTGFDPQTVQPVASHYTDYATWPTNCKFTSQ